MSKDLNVTVEEQAGLANQIQSFHNELQSRITSLNGVVDRVQSGWQGAAGKEYDAVQQRLNDRLRSMRVELVKLEETMRMSASGFSRQEDERIASFRRMDDSSGGRSSILGMA
jgi:WXG100 family type VII secretion target